jgi:hypothetical protein
MYTSDTSKQIPETASTFFNEEMIRIIKIAQTTRRDSISSTPFVSLLTHDLLATDVFAKRSIKPDHYQVLPGGNVNADIWQLYADVQGFYIFSGKVMLAMYLLLAESVNEKYAPELRKHIGTHGKFLKYVESKETELSETLRTNIGHSLKVADRCIYRKRNKMIEHWADNEHQRNLFPCYYLIDAPLLYFVNNDTFEAFAADGSVASKADRFLAKVKRITIDPNTRPADKLAILDYFYPKLSRNDQTDIDNLMDIRHIIALPVSPHLITAYKKFMNDTLDVIELLK